MGAKKKMQDLPGWVKALLGVFGALDVVLRVLAVMDAAKRPDDELNGPKKVWLPALSVVSSFGLLPAVYFLLGRRDD
ncbi:MAG: hypothetical protein Q4G35_05935 [Propionibacteriaceae bacterium]|nr:hypothetical protein [Propionibacteriaceae bacterium]